MRIQIISDVHCEFHRDGGIAFCNQLPVMADTLVIAGDFATYREFVKCMTILCESFTNIVFVCGNHEYYGANRGDIHNNIVKIANRFPNFHWLNNSFVEIEGKRFIGATMWFRDTPYNWMYKDQLNDFHVIQGFSKWVYKENRETIDFFNKNMKQGDIVITHHAPCELSVSDYFKASDTNRFYVCDMTSLIYTAKPSYWIHGHMHTNSEYQIYDSWVICNPYGYDGGYEKVPHVSQYVKVIDA